MSTRTMSFPIVVGTTRGVAERWHKQYPADDRSHATTRHRGIGRALDALYARNPEPDREAVESIIGNRSWTRVQCQSCGEHQDRCVSLDDCSALRYCASCLRLALRALNEREAP
jgi:hypothetical protein